MDCLSFVGASDVGASDVGASDDAPRYGNDFLAGRFGQRRRLPKTDSRIADAPRATVRSDPNDSVARSPAGSTRGSIFSRAKMGRRVNPRITSGDGDDAEEWVNMTGTRWTARDRHLDQDSSNIDNDYIIK
jgi:hypothetical protein